MKIEIYYRRKASTIKKLTVETDIDISYYDLMFDDIINLFTNRTLIVEMILPQYKMFEKGYKVFISKELKIVDYLKETPIKDFLYSKGIRIATRNGRFSHILGGV